MMKKRIIFLASLIGITSLTGCEPPDDIIIPSVKEQYEEGATDISMWCADFEEWQNQLNQKQRIEFNSNLNDGINLKQTFIEQNDIDDRLRSARETNSTPDIYMISIGNLYKEVKNGYALDITNYIDTWDDLILSAKESVTYNNTCYGYPICLEPSTLLFYRQDLLKQYGNVDEVPTNWNDFLTLCDAVKTNLKSNNVKGVYTFDVPKGVDCAWGTWGMQIAASDGLAITDDWTESRLLTEGKDGYLALGNLWSSLYGKGYVPLSSGAYNEYIKDLCLGKLVMTTAGSWSVSEIVNTYPELINKIKVMPMPTFDGNQNVTTATNGVWVYVLSRSCKNVEKAIEVIKYLVAGDDTSRTEEYFTKAYYSKSSPRKSVQNKIEQSLLSQTKVPTNWVETINDVASKACLEPIYDWNISVAIELYLEECAMGEDINNSLTKADNSIKKIIESNKTTNPRK